MPNPFISTEIRWFTQDKGSLFSIYHNLPGDGAKESKRTDYYLRAPLDNTGIKIRQGRHEIKVKNGTDDHHRLGLIENFAKWSNDEPINILNTISADFRNQWIAVKKERWKKIYKWNSDTQQVEYEMGRQEDGCGVEFTHLLINNEVWYTFGLEAFGTHRTSKQNLLETLEFLQLPEIDPSRFPNLGYPAFLNRF